MKLLILTLTLVLWTNVFIYTKSEMSRTPLMRHLTVRNDFLYKLNKPRNITFDTKLKDPNKNSQIELNAN